VDLEGLRTEETVTNDESTAETDESGGRSETDEGEADRGVKRPKTDEVGESNKEVGDGSG
jgi:hypothetical protein